jgi:glutamate synthase (NADPH/NADH) large chain
VTNPPIDPDPRGARHEPRLDHRAAAKSFDLEGVLVHQAPEVRQPILTNDDLEKIRSISEVGDGHFKSRFSTRPGRAEHGAAGLKDALDNSARAPRRQCARASTSSSCPTGAPVREAIPIPSPLACAAVHHHLIRQGLRTSVGLVVESGEPREVHHFLLPRWLRR